MVRSGASPGIHLQPRDFAVLAEVAHARAVTLRHLAGLHFDGRYPAAVKRVGALRRHELLAVQDVRLPAQSNLIRLTHEGYQALGSHEPPTIPWSTIRRRQQVLPSLLRHELEVMDVKAAIVPAVNRSPDRRVTEFTTLTSALTRHSSSSSKPLYPDAYLQVEEKDRATHLFIEHDRSTQSQRLVQEKAVAYRTYYQSGGFAATMQLPPDQYRTAPFRVLVVCRSHARRDNLAASLLRLVPPVLSQCWFATFAEVVANPLGPIWLTPQTLRMARRESSQSPVLLRL